MMRLPALLSFVALFAAAPAAAAEIGQIRAHLLYERTGTLSENIAPPSKFSAWNTIIGEGDAKEPANDLLIMVEVKGSGGEENIATSLKIVARGEGGKLLGQRSHKDLLATDGRFWKALLLHDVGCAGTIEIVASIGRSSKYSKVELACGE